MSTIPKHASDWFVNALSVRFEEGGVVPLRFTPEQLEHFQSSMRSLCPAGIRLEVDTDAVTLELEVESLGATRPYCWFDLFVDDVLVDRAGRDEFPAGELTVHFALPGEGLRRVAVQLPQNAQLVFRRIDWSPGASIHPVKEDKPLLLGLGDSITQGMDSHYPSSPYLVQLARHLDMRLLNQAVGGYVFNEDSLAPLPGLTPSLITVAYGTNDWGKWSSPEELRTQAARYLDRLLTLFPQSRIVLLTPLWRKNERESKPTGTLQDVRNTLQQLCEERGIPWLDGKRLLANIPHFYQDGLHPNDEGFARLALELSRRLRALPL